MLFEEITCYLFVNYVTTEHIVQAFVQKYFKRNFVCCIVHNQTVSGDRIAIISLYTSSTGSLQFSVLQFFSVFLLLTWFLLFTKQVTPQLI